MNNKKYISRVLLGALVAVMAVPAFVSAAEMHVGTGQGGTSDMSVRRGGNGQDNSRGMMNGVMGMRGGEFRPVAIGTVSSINGTTLTVVGKKNIGSDERVPDVTDGNNFATTTFTVTATNAQVRKNNATSTLSSIAVGDMVSIEGTISGTSVTATVIHDGAIRGFGMKAEGKAGGMMGVGRQASSTIMMGGNGQPIIAGKVSAISGAILTITNNSNVAYSIDTTNAKITQGNTTISLANIIVGDTILAQGTINGTSVIATTVMDQTNHSTTNISTTTQNIRKGMFGGLGQLFMRMFGF